MNAIKFNQKTKMYEIGTLRKGKFTVKDTGNSSIELTRKHYKRVVFYNGEYSFLTKN